MNQPDTLTRLSWRYQIMDLQGEALKKEIDSLGRNTIIDWLQWNDRNGV